MLVSSAWIAVALTACSSERSSEPAEQPQPEASRFPYKVVAVERENLREGRQVSYDPAGIAKVVATLGDAESWTPSSMPRCEPALWGRLVPASGVGGVTYQYCTPGMPAHLWVPEKGAMALSRAASLELYRALVRVKMKPGVVAPAAVLASLDDWTLTATEVDANGKKRTASFSTRASDGVLLLPKPNAKAVTYALAASGFFERAQRFHTANPGASAPPPTGSTEGSPPAPEPPTAWLELSFTHDGWKQTWQEANAAPAVHHSVSALKEAGLPPEAEAALEAFDAREKP